MRAICYELKKLTAGKPFIIATLLLLAYFAFMAFCDFDKGLNVIQSMSEEQSTQVTEERLAEIKKEYELLLTKMGAMTAEESERYTATRYIIKQAEYIGGYPEKMSRLALQLYERAKAAAASGNAYETEYYKAAMNSYNSVKDISAINGAGTACLFARFHGPFATDDININEMISLRWGYVFIVWAVLISAWLFCCEREYKTDCIVFTACRGKGTEFLRKLAAIALTAGAITLVTTLAEILYAILIYKVDIFASIQSYAEFELCPLGINILTAVIIMQLMMYVAVMFTVLLTALFSIKASSPIRGMVLGVVFAAASYGLMTSYWNISSADQSAQLDIIRTVFPPELIHPKNYLTGFDMTPLFGVPVPRLAMVIAVSLLFIIAAAAVCAVFYGRSADIRWKAKLLSLIKSRKATEA